jgi:hypothetical protein
MVPGMTPHVVSVVMPQGCTRVRKADEFRPSHAGPRDHHNKQLRGQVAELAKRLKAAYGEIRALRNAQR